jgi:hypothetical protein
VSAQVQPITTGDLRKLDALNIQGVSQKAYLNGTLRGLQRINSLGGDLVVLDTGETYLVKAVLEQWAAGNVMWVCAAIVLQNDAKTSHLDRPAFSATPGQPIQGREAESPTLNGRG